MGGDVTMTSRPGEGSRFEVRVMLSGRPAEPRRARPASERTSRTRRRAANGGARRTILVADDDEAHRDLMVEVLRPLGFIVLTAADGPTALRLVCGDPPRPLPPRHPRCPAWTAGSSPGACGRRGRTARS